jgi:hypothetical protein
MDGSSRVERNHLGQTQLAVLQGWYNARGQYHNLNPSASREAGSFFGAVFSFCYARKMAIQSRRSTSQKRT